MIVLLFCFKKPSATEESTKTELVMDINSTVFECKYYSSCDSVYKYIKTIYIIRA